MQRIDIPGVTRAPSAARVITDFCAATPKHNEPMRLDSDLCAAIRQIATACNVSTCAVLSRIVRDAMPYVAIDGALIEARNA